MFETTPPARARRSQAGETHRVARQGHARSARPCAGRGKRTARSGTASGSSRALGGRRDLAAWCGCTPSRTVNPRQQRVVRVGDRRGVVGQRHDLALVLELPHVEQAGHLLEEHAQRDRAATRPPGSAVPRERPKWWHDKPSPTPSMVSDRGRAVARRPRGGGRVRLVMIEQPQVRMGHSPWRASRSRASAIRLSASNGALGPHSVTRYFKPLVMARESDPGRPAGGAPRSSAPCSPATTGSRSWPGRTWRPRRCRSARASARRRPGRPRSNGWESGFRASVVSAVLR